MKKGKYDKHFWIPATQFGDDVVAVFGSGEYFDHVMRSYNVCDESIKEMREPDDNGMSVMMTSDNGGKYHALWVSGRRFTDLWFGILAHEISHTIDTMFERWSVPAGTESSELRANLVGNYTELIIRRLKNRKPMSMKEKWGTKV